MNKIMLLSLIVVLVSLTVVVGYVGYNRYYMVDTLSKDLHLEVGDKIGVNLDTDKIYFGKTHPGGMAKRHLNISNNYGFSVRTNINVEGEITDFISVSENNFIIEPHSSKEITYYAETTEDTEKGTYEGKTIVVFKRVLFKQ